MQLSRAIRFVLNPRALTCAYRLVTSGYLIESGWLNSYYLARPVDAKGNTIPWLTLPFLDFIRPRLKPQFDLLEFGAGNSTIFFSNHVGSTTSIESSKEWAMFVQGRVQGKKVTIFECAPPQYWEVVDSFTGAYDIVLVDGIERFQCTQKALRVVKSDGVIVLDNSYRSEYSSIYKLLADRGWKHIDFTGLAPGARHSNQTTVFYRESNCLGI